MRPNQVTASQMKIKSSANSAIRQREMRFSLPPLVCSVGAGVASGVLTAGTGDAVAKGTGDDVAEALAAADAKDGASALDAGCSEVGSAEDSGGMAAAGAAGATAASESSLDAISSSAESSCADDAALLESAAPSEDSADVSVGACAPPSAPPAPSVGSGAPPTAASEPVFPDSCKSGPEVGSASFACIGGSWAPMGKVGSAWRMTMGPAFSELLLRFVSTSMAVTERSSSATASVAARRAGTPGTIQFENRSSQVTFGAGSFACSGVS